jgi:hypothetical protein
LNDAVIDEVRRAVSRIQERPLPTLLRTPNQFELPHLTAVIEQVRDILDNGLGVAIIDRLPVDDMTVEEAKALFWTIGQLLAPPVAQQGNGTVLYDVTDTGKTFQYGVRGSYTNIELVFHTDNAFGRRPPDYVGLMCLHPALEGGTSRFANVTAVHDCLLDSHPQLLARLYEPMLWDRQAEHGPGAARISRAPMFRYDRCRLSVRFNTSLVRRGYALAGQPIDEVLEQTLVTVKSIVDDPNYWSECPIERGQLQYLNNNDIVHYRSEFKDPPEELNPRHLVRMWHRTRGDSTYDG